MKSKNHDGKEQPLQCGIEDGQLVIRIGINVVAFASRPENGGCLDDCIIEPDKEEEFAKDVSSEMMRDNGEGPFPLPDFIDKMICAAADAGSAALIWNKK